MLSIGFFALERSATSDILARGQLSSEKMASLRLALSEWFAGGNDLERQYELLRVENAKLLDYLQETVPVWHFTAEHPLLSGLPKSKFPFDIQQFLADQRIESLLSIYLIRLKFVTESAGV